MKRNERLHKTYMDNQMLDDWKIMPLLFNGIQRPISIITEWAL